MNTTTLLKIAGTGLAATAVSLFSAGGASAAGLANPSTNRVLSGAALTACMSNPTGAECTSDTLADINAARAADGVAPMVLPTNYSTLTGPQQLMVLANLERADRGLKVLVIGLAGDLTRNAQSAAAADADPTASPWNGNSMSSNWAGGYDTPLEADFSWMYDDGIGSPNQDCTTGNTSGCWGHRMDILMNFDPPLMMGAAVGSGQYGTSMTELFVGGDTEAAPGHADAPVGPTWSQLTGQPNPAPGAGSDTGSGSGAGGSAAGSSNPTGGSGSTQAARNSSASNSQPVAKPASSTQDQTAHPAAASAPQAPGAPLAKAGAVCTVPHLQGLPLSRAIRALVRANCGIGQIVSVRASVASARRYGKKHHGRKLHVIVQSVRAGSHRHAGFRVALRVR